MAYTVCAGPCGQVIVTNKKSLQPGQATCQACRRERASQRQCKICGTLIGVDRRLRVTCSDQCQVAAATEARGMQLHGEWRGATCEICATAYRRTYVEQRTCGRACGVELKRRTAITVRCEGCGESFETTAVSGLARFCSPRCRPPRPVKAPREPLSLRHCPRCTAEFRPAHWLRIYCSFACQRASANDRSKEIHAATYERRIGTPRNVDLVCSRCRSTFVVVAGVRGSGINRLYCDTCRPALERQKNAMRGRRRAQWRRAARSEPYTLDEIALRDKFQCGLCFDPVDMTLRVPELLSPTIDHLTPLSLGGDDIPDNVQLAHFICNSRRGALDVEIMRRRLAREAQWSLAQ